MNRFQITFKSGNVEEVEANGYRDTVDGGDWIDFLSGNRNVGEIQILRIRAAMVEGIELVPTES